MPIYIKGEDIPERKRIHTGERGEGTMVVKKAYGSELSLMLAVREPGYHSKPHFHESDQVIYVLDGEMWFFVADQGFHCRNGDFLRIPSNSMQWDWNRSKKKAIVIEAHAPALVGGPSGEGAVGLFDNGESPEAKSPAKNTFVTYDSEAIEKKYNLC